MSQTGQKSINQWTDKHEQFCFENKLCPCARALWQWLLKHKDDEPDLKEFNKYVSKHRGKPYCRPHLKAAFNQLIECRVIRLVKTFTWHLVRIVTRTIADLFPKKNCRHQHKSYAEQPSNQEIAKKNKTEAYNNTKYSYTDTEKREILLECGKEGIFFNPKKESDLFKYSREDITHALLFYRGLDQRSKKYIYNPPGWFLVCLEYKYWECSNLDFGGFLSILIENTPVRS